MQANRNIYAEKALNQVPRLLGNQDRNRFSPTYGCFHRDYWLDKTSDFPDAVRQFSAHTLALVYKYDFPNNIYKGKSKIRDWAIAGLNYWASIQHKEGSFDEFYPFERGWVGPSAFTTYSSIEAYKLLKEEIPGDISKRIINAIRRAAYFVAGGETEEDDLANHHAMACLAVWKAYELLGEKALKEGFEKLFAGFLKYFKPEEGWSIEYDGVDAGYLSATISFFAKIYQTHPDQRILEVLKKSIEFSSYFVYPNGFYAGSTGSRNTLHFYPHGYEIMAEKIPLAGAVAEKMLIALGENKLIPPEIISDRYVVYRVPEFLQAWLDYRQRLADIPLLPFEQEPYTRHFNISNIYVKNTPEKYIIANLAKGGVIKIFDKKSQDLILNDCGLIGRTQNGSVVTSQWIDPSYNISIDESGWGVNGSFNLVPSNKLFTPLKLIIFRFILLLMGWSPKCSHLLKGRIRKMLILGQRPVPLQFERTLQSIDDTIILSDKINISGNITLSELHIGDEFFVRYVPQSRYFQAQELNIAGYVLSSESLKRINSKQPVTIEREIDGAKITYREKT